MVKYNPKSARVKMVNATEAEDSLEVIMDIHTILSSKSTPPKPLSLVPPQDPATASHLASLFSAPPQPASSNSPCSSSPSPDLDHRIADLAATTLLAEPVVSPPSLPQLSIPSGLREVPLPEGLVQRRRIRPTPAAAPASAVVGAAPQQNQASHASVVQQTWNAMEPKTSSSSSPQLQHPWQSQASRSHLRHLLELQLRRLARRLEVPHIPSKELQRLWPRLWSGI
ncbi:uncharacterized protein LOC123426480 [Hordeum vulgare subsp. vulgare]|uniref:uncharacterized protein LOC123426480 n=1 Tax=Hordeum vulgare subsp. vulgare TaxID=112509 RepID=UPI001D1A57EE|nr:uncharacterized protein LOC123426480 [Hordeum vulgare subsp. vulgare]